MTPVGLQVLVFTHVSLPVITQLVAPVASFLGILRPQETVYFQLTKCFPPVKSINP